MQGIFHRDLRMENLLLQGSFYDSVLKISNFGYSKSAVLDSVAVTLGLGGGGQGQVSSCCSSCSLLWSTAVSASL